MKDMENHGFIKVASSSPTLRVANPYYNVREIEKLIFEAESKNAAIIVFPELCITGYSCGDLFLQEQLLIKTQDALNYLLNQTKDLNILSVVGLPIPMDDKLYNCAAVLHRGKILGIVPKTFLPNYKEYDEKRWFVSGCEISRDLSEIIFADHRVYFGHLLFRNDQYNITLGIEIAEDLWSIIPPSSYLALYGANIIANPSAGNDLAGKAQYRKKLVEQQSARCICGYIYTEAGVYESTTDMVFGGHCIIAENGVILKENERFQRKNSIIYS